MLLMKSNLHFVKFLFWDSFHREDVEQLPEVENKFSTDRHSMIGNVDLTSDDIRNRLRN
jgi:hypothetical protein